jgi:site-specific DNA recombinase
MTHLDPPLEPRDGKKLKTLVIARVSKPAKDKPVKRRSDGRDELSLEDQEALLEGWLKRNYDGPYKLDVIAGTGSGELLDREESLRISEAVRSGEYDLVLTEDLGRVFRRMHAFLFCELCEDYSTRFIALNDQGLDTARDDWRMAAFFAAYRHEAYNRDTAARIRRSLRNRFTNGGIFQQAIFGYRKPKGAKSDDRVTKIPSAAKIYEKWFRMLEQGLLYSDVADWLNAKKVPVGPHCRTLKWTGRMVQRITFNTILKGWRVRNKRMAKRVNESGRRKSILAPPEDLLERHCPHLAFINPARYDRLIAKLTLRNSKYRRRRHLSKKWRAWPGQHIECGVCGRIFYWGGHGTTDHMMCSGNREYLCWNATTFDGVDAAKRISKAVLDLVESLPGFDASFQKLVERKAKARQAGVGRKQKKIEMDLAKVRRQLKRVEQTILNGAHGSRTLAESLVRLEAEEAVLVQEASKVADAAELREFKLPTMDKLKAEMRIAMQSMSDSAEFGKCMRDLVPSITVFPHRLCDGGATVLRAKLVVNLVPLVPPLCDVKEVQSVLRHELTIDLFDLPERERHRQAIASMRASGLTERQAAEKLGITITAAQRAAALQRLMISQGLADPYLPVRKPVVGNRKARCHLHPRYRFEPLPGFPAW